MKISLAALAGGIVVWAAVSMTLAKFTDPEQNLSRIAKQVAAGPKSPEDARRLKADFDQAVRNYLSRIGDRGSSALSEKLRKLLPASAFEVHIVDLPRGLRVVEVDTVLQASDYLVIKSNSGTRVVSLPGLEVFDDARIINESAGPMLVMLGHSGGQPPHKPQVRVYALLPDDISDETDKLLPAIRGEGSARFAPNNRDIVLDLSLASLAQQEKLFAGTPTEEGTARQYLEWRDAHYVSRYDYGVSPLATLYAVARCLRYPDLVTSHRRFLGAAGEKLVNENKSAQAGDFQIKRIGLSGGQATYSMKGNIGAFQLQLEQAAGIWTVASHKGLSPLAEAAVAPSAPPPVAIATAAKKTEPPPAPAVVTRAAERTRSQPSPTESTERLTHREQLTAHGRNRTPQEIPLAASRLPEPAVARARATVEPPRAEKPLERARDKKSGADSRQTKPVTAAAQPHTVAAVDRSAALPPGEKASIARQIAASSVNLRSGPTTDAKPVAELGKGADIEIVGKENGWYKVRYGGKEGYVYAGLVDYKTPQAYTTATVKKSRPVIDSKQKQVLRPQVGERLVIEGGIENDKYKVRLASGRIGYVDKDAVDVAVDEPPMVP